MKAQAIGLGFGTELSAIAPTGRPYRCGIIESGLPVMAAPLGLYCSWFTFPGPLAQADIGLSRWDGDAMLGALGIAHENRLVQFLCDFATTWHPYESPGHRPGFRARTNPQKPQRGGAIDVESLNLDHWLWPPGAFTRSIMHIAYIVDHSIQSHTYRSSISIPWRLHSRRNSS